MNRRRWIGAVAAAVICFAVAGTARAQDASAADKEKAQALLDSSKRGVLAATKGLSEAQWNFKPAPDKWSIAECMEHIAAAEDFIRGTVEENVMKAPAAPDRDTAKIDAAIIANVPDRSNRFQAPEPPNRPIASARRKPPSSISSRAAQKPRLS